MLLQRQIRWVLCGQFFLIACHWGSSLFKYEMSLLVMMSKHFAHGLYSEFTFFYSKKQVSWLGHDWHPLMAPPYYMIYPTLASARWGKLCVGVKSVGV